MKQDDMNPGAWLAAVLTRVDGKNPVNHPYKVLSQEIDMHGPSKGRSTFRVLCRDSGAIWSFKCEVERQGAS